MKKVYIVDSTFHILLLLSPGVNVNSTTLYGRTPLHAAVAKDRAAMAEFLLSKGATLQKPDCFGVVPIELAQQMSSNTCFRKLRIMQLNLRGNYNKDSNKKTRICIKLDTAGRPEIYHPERTQSTLSDYSQSKFDHETNRHASRKLISSSAPYSGIRRENLMSREGTQSSLSNATTSKIRQRNHNVSWKDTKTEITYLRHLNLHKKGQHGVEETVKVKPMTLVHPKTIVKYSDIAKQEAMKNMHLIDTSSNTENHSKAPSDENKDLTKVMKYSKERYPNVLNVYISN